MRGGTSGTSVGTPGQTGPIIIASVGNYSGPAGVGQIGIPRGVQTWATWVNSRGGLFGRQVQVIVVDDGGDPARYASTVQDLVENRGVVAFVGNGAALSMDGGIKYLNSRGVPVIGSECSRYEWHQYPVFFPECPHYDFMISDLPRAAALLSKFRKFGFVACSEAAGCQNLKRPIAKGVAESGGKVVYQADISLTQIDFTAECRNAQQAGVELMFVGADANTLLRWARSCDRQRFHPQYFGGGTSVTASVIQQRGLENIILSSPVFPFQAGNGGAIDEFNRAVARYGDGSPDPGEAQGWASAKMFELMATRAAAKSRSITPATILAAGHTFDHETLGGLTAPLTFTGRTPTTPNCHFVMRGSRNGWTTPLGSGMRCA